jgi:hypothetical protein
LLFSDLIYMDLRSDNNSGPLGITSIDARLQEYIGSLNAGYRVVDVPLDNDAAKGPRLTVDGYAGVRYTWMEATLNPFNGKTRSQSEDWWDPLIGARARLAVTPKFSMTLRYDYGGWGVGAERTWFLFAGAEWSVSEAIALGVGYATLYQDYYGSNTFHYEATMQGPVFSLAFNF